MNLMKSLINFKNLNYLFLFTLIILSFYLSLYFVFTDYRDEIGYLSDSCFWLKALDLHIRTHQPAYQHGLERYLFIWIFLITCIKNFRPKYEIII